MDAIVDKYTGATRCPAGHRRRDEATTKRVDFRPGSRLLIVAGCFNDECDDNSAKAARFFYAWTGTQLRRIGTCPLAIEPLQ